MTVKIGDHHQRDEGPAHEERQEGELEDEEADVLVELRIGCVGTGDTPLVKSR